MVIFRAVQDPSAVEETANSDPKVKRRPSVRGSVRCSDVTAEGSVEGRDVTWSQRLARTQWMVVPLTWGTLYPEHRAIAAAEAVHATTAAAAAAAVAAAISACVLCSAWPIMLNQITV